MTKLIHEFQPTCAIPGFPHAGRFCRACSPIRQHLIDFLTLGRFPGRVRSYGVLWNKVDLMVSHLGVEGHGQEVGSLKFSSMIYDTFGSVALPEPPLKPFVLTQSCFN